MDEERVVIDPRREAADHVLTRKQSWEDSMQDWREGRARLDKRYHNYREDLASSDDKAQGTPRANIGVPLAAETVDTANAQACDSFFRSVPFGKVWGREETDQYKSEIVQQVVDYQQQTTELPSVSKKIFRDAFKYGLGVGKLKFERQTKRVPVPKTLFGFDIGGMTWEDRVVCESPVLTHVHIQDIFFPRDAVSVDKAEGIIHRTWQTREEVLGATDGLGLPLYDPAGLSTLRSAAPGSAMTDSNLKTERDTRKIGDGGLAKDNRLEILEYTGKLPDAVSFALAETVYPDADPRGDWIITVVANGNEPLRCEPSPFLTNKRMYVFAKVIDDPGYLAGISIIEFVERLGLTIDELYNIVLDNLNFVINKQYYINTLAGVDEADVYSSPGKVIRGTRPFREAMEVIHTPDIAQSVFVVLNALLSHYKEYTGITSMRLGASQPGTETATEIAAIVRNSSTRLGQFEKTLEDSFMQPLFSLWVVLNQQFLDQEFVIRVFKDSQIIYPKVAPEDIQGVFDFRFEGAARAESIALLSGQIMQMLQINATQPVPIFDPVYLGKKLVDAWGWTDSERALNPMFQEQYMMYQQMAALKNMGETAKALTPDQQRAAKAGGNPAKQGNAAQPDNSAPNKDFRSALTAVKEAALPQGPAEG